jgi:hypothetical protein
MFSLPVQWHHNSMSERYAMVDRYGIVRRSSPTARNPRFVFDPPLLVMSTGDVDR